MKRFVRNFSQIRQKYKKHALVALLTVAIVLLLGISIKPILVMAALVLVASMSTFYHNFIRQPINFELVKLSAICVAYVYGATAGIAVGILSVIIGRALSGRLDQDTITSVAAISIVAYLAAAFNTQPIAVLGIFLVILYHMLILPFLFLFGENVAYEAVYIGSNIAINLVIFINVAPFLVRIIS